MISLQTWMQIAQPLVILRPPRHDHAVVAGKDAVPRATVSNLSRLMDEMVTALARCKQPKLKVGWAQLGVVRGGPD